MSIDLITIAEGGHERTENKTEFLHEISSAPRPSQAVIPKVGARVNGPTTISSSVRRLGCFRIS